MVRVVTPLVEPDMSWGHSIESEQAVLGALLLDNGAFDSIADLVSEGDFYTGDHRAIFRAVSSLIEDNKPADVLTVCELLDRRGELDRAGGRDYVASLEANTPSAANVRRYAEIVAERAILRGLFTAAQQVMDSARASRGRNVREILDEAQARMMSIRDARRGGIGDFHSVNDVLVEVVEFIDTQHMLHQQNKSNLVTGLPTGFVDLDNMTTGLHPGQLIILAARPAMGKSAMVLNIAEHAAQESKKTVAVFSMEMSLRELGLRLIASEAGVNVQRLVVGRVSDDEWPRVTDAVGKLNDLPIAFNEIAGITVMEMRALARRAAREFGGLSLIIVDYLQLMLGGSSEANRATQLAEISRGLKLLAKELQVPVIALSQLNRDLEKRPNKRPIMSDLRDSGAIEQDADMILFLYRDEVYNAESLARGTAEVIVGKQRNGPTGTIKLVFRADHTRFLNHVRDF